MKDYVPLDDIDPAVYLDRVTMTTAEVEEVEQIGKHFPQVVAARVTKVEPHPNADKLRLVEVDYGMGALSVVCGAPNVAEGQLVALARTGTELPGGKLKASTIRGVRSEGMICAEDELGLSDDHEGILVLPDDIPKGTPLNKIFGDPDIVLEIDNKSLTHRPDLWGHIGFAREIGAIFEKPMIVERDESLLNAPDASDSLKIENRAEDLCPRYSALVVDNVAVKPSPEWLQQRLRAVGLRPINNLVDVTNYVMMEYGQPMHAFDRRQIEGDTIVIRRADEGEPFTTLDEQEHVLGESDIVIADAKRAVALGGVMGGLNSSVVDDTRCIVLESANFHPATIRRTANRLQLRTDSAIRFEKGQDPENTRPSIIRAVELIRLTCPEAKVISPFLDSWPDPPRPVTISIDFEHIHSRLGERLPEATILKILRSLDFRVEMVGNQGMNIQVPSYRATRDVTIKADIIEEIGRVYGYDNIAPTPPLVFSDPPMHNELRRFEWKIRDIFCKILGFDEVMNYSFTNEETMRKCGLDPEPGLRLRNPLSVEADRMRTDLIPGMIEFVAGNQKNFDTFRMVELGRAYLKENRTDPELATEKRRIAGAVFNESETPFLNAKGALRDFLTLLGIKSFSFDPVPAPPWGHPGRSAGVTAYGKPIGILAELHPMVADRFGIRKRAALFDLDQDKLFDLPRPDTAFEPIRRYPVNPIEITVVVDKKRPVAEIEDVIRKAGKKRLVDLSFLYLYEGEKIPEDKKAVTYHLVFGANDRTLDSEEIAETRTKLVEALRSADMPLRGEEENGRK